jgi:hypothetical protein
MCDKCDDIDGSIVRFRRLKGQINDEKMRIAAERLMAELAAQKVALHSERSMP